MKLRRLLLTLTAMLWLAGSAHAASTTISATATIQSATITLSNVNALDFGTIVATGVCGILIDASSGAGVSTVNSGIATITVAGTSGRIDVDSPVSATVNITYAVASTTGSVADTIDDGAGHSMTFTAASIRTYSTGGGTNPGTLAMVAGVTNSIHVGGLLQVASAQTAGTYTGTITVGVNY